MLINKIFKTEIKVLSVLQVLFIKNKTLKIFKTKNVLSVLRVLFIKEQNTQNIQNKKVPVMVVLNIKGNEYA